MTTNPAKNAPIQSDAPAIAGRRVAELKALIGNHAALITTNVWDDVTRQLVGIVTADALLVSAFPSSSPIGAPGPDGEGSDPSALLGPPNGDHHV